MKRNILIAIVLGVATAMVTSEAAAQYYRHSSGGVQVRVNLGGSSGLYCPHSYRPSYGYSSHYYRPPAYVPHPVVVHPRPYSHPPVYGSMYYPSPGVEIANGVLSIVSGAINAHNSHGRPSHGGGHGSHGGPSHGGGHGSHGGPSHGGGHGSHGDSHGGHRR